MVGRPDRHRRTNRTGRMYPPCSNSIDRNGVRTGEQYGEADRYLTDSAPAKLPRWPSPTTDDHLMLHDATRDLPLASPNLPAISYSLPHLAKLRGTSFYCFERSVTHP